MKGHVQLFRSNRPCFRLSPLPAPARRQAARKTLTCAKAKGKQKVANPSPSVITAPLQVWPPSFTLQSETCACICSCTEPPIPRVKGGQAAACLAQVQVKEQLTPVEKLSMAPFWSTFCGTSNGAWQGVQAAFSPVTGKALRSSSPTLVSAPALLARGREHPHKGVCAWTLSAAFLASTLG